MDGLTLNGDPVSAKDAVNTLLVSGFQHHFPVVLGHYVQEIKEMAAWLGLGAIQKIPYEDSLQIL